MTVVLLCSMWKLGEAGVTVAETRQWMYITCLKATTIIRVMVEWLRAACVEHLVLSLLLNKLLQLVKTAEYV